MTNRDCLSLCQIGSANKDRLVGFQAVCIIFSPGLMKDTVPVLKKEFFQIFVHAVEMIVEGLTADSAVSRALAVTP